MSVTASGSKSTYQRNQTDGIFGEGSLDAQFIGQCRDSCGMRASFKGGKLIEHVTANSKTVNPPRANGKQSQAIQLWTGNKLLGGDIATCAKKVEDVLNTLGFTNITNSIYPTETYFYANLNEIRTGIHCTRIAGQTFVHGSVAGLDVKIVELLRNNIFGKL